MGGVGKGEGRWVGGIGATQMEVEVRVVETEGVDVCRLELQVERVRRDARVGLEWDHGFDAEQGVRALGVEEDAQCHWIRKWRVVLCRRRGITIIEDLDRTIEARAGQSTTSRGRWCRGHTCHCDEDEEGLEARSNVSKTT